MSVHRHTSAPQNNINLLKPRTYFMYHQLHIHKFYVLPITYLCLLRGSQNEQRLFPYKALTCQFYNQGGECLLRGMDWVFKSDRNRFVLKALNLKFTHHVHILFSNTGLDGYKPWTDGR
jgi:hypothetical protein